MPTDSQCPRQPRPALLEHDRDHVRRAGHHDHDPRLPPALPPLATSHAETDRLPISLMPFTTRSGCLGFYRYRVEQDLAGLGHTLLTRLAGVSVTEILRSHQRASFWWSKRWRTRRLCHSASTSSIMSNLQCRRLCSRSARTRALLASHATRSLPPEGRGMRGRNKVAARVRTFPECHVDDSTSRRRLDRYT